jgi:hypothetical protein
MMLNKYAIRRDEVQTEEIKDIRIFDHCVRSEHVCKIIKAVPLHATKALWERRGIARTHSRPLH